MQNDLNMQNKTTWKKSDKTKKSLHWHLRRHVRDMLVLRMLTGGHPLEEEYFSCCDAWFQKISCAAETAICRQTGSPQPLCVLLCVWMIVDCDELFCSEDPSVFVQRARFASCACSEWLERSASDRKSEQFLALEARGGWSNLQETKRINAASSLPCPTRATGAFGSRFFWLGYCSIFVFIW